MSCPQVTEYSELHASHRLVFLVCKPRIATAAVSLPSKIEVDVACIGFRGHWCPFCMTYLKQLGRLQPRVEAAGGAVVAVTAEDGSHLQATRDKSGFKGTVIVDPEHSLARHLEGKIKIATSSKSGYPHGMAQPGVLIMTAEGTVLGDWAIEPSMMNLGGATDRPDLEQMWENAEAKNAGKGPVHAQYRKMSVVQGVKQAVFG